MNRAHQISTSDPHATLGVPHDADPETIKRAWRNLAKTLHPDVAADDPHALARYHAVTDAYQRLMRHKSSVRTLQARAEAAAREIQNTRAHTRRLPQRGADVHLPLKLSLEDWFSGADRAIQLPTGKKVLIRLDATWPSGHILRLKGMGEPGKHGGAAGDVYLTLSPLPHAQYQIDGHDLYTLHAIPQAQMVAGNTLHIPTPRGLKAVKLPGTAHAGSRIRLKGQGLPHEDGVGDLYLTLKVVSGDNTRFADKLSAFWNSWAGRSEDDIRRGFDAVA
jgi:DnaJ-class molecular chaperone